MTRGLCRPHPNGYRLQAAMQRIPMSLSDTIRAIAASNRAVGLGLVLAMCWTPATAAARSGQDLAGVDAGAESQVAVPEPTQQAMAFHHSGNAWWVVARAIAIVLPMVLFVSGVSGHLRTLAWRLGRHALFAGALYLLAYLLLYELILLPLTYYLGFVRAHDYGLSRESLAGWAVDELKEIGVMIAVATPAFLVAYALLKRSPRHWWLWCSALAVPAIFFLTMIAPIWIDPLFNDFAPMKDRALEARILDLAQRTGIDVDRVFEVDMSRKTTAVNAYVTGFLGTKRIVLWDTLLAKLEPEQVLSVMGHEMGHFVLNHLLTGVAVVCALAFVGLGATHALATRLLPLLARWSRVEALGDFASLPLLISIAMAVGLVLTPVGYAFSRHSETEADRFSLELLRDNRAAAASFVALQRENLGFPRPGPLYQILRGSHPSLGERIDFCNTYRPWERAQPLRYGSILRSE